MEEDVWNQDSHSRHHVKVAIAKLALSSGFQSMNQQPLNCLADIMERYINTIGQRAMEFAEHANHNEANFMDVFAALNEMGTQPHFLRNLIDFTDPMAPVEVPKYPEYQPRIKGLNFTDEIDDNLPEFVHPWMPSIKATNKRHESAEKAKEEVKEEVQSSDGEDEAPSAPPSAPGGARGADQYFPEQPDSADESSCPPTPMTPAIPVPEQKSSEKPKPEKRTLGNLGFGDLSDSSNSPPSTKSIPSHHTPLKPSTQQQKLSMDQPKPTEQPVPVISKSTEKVSTIGSSKLDQLDDMGLFKITPPLPKREKPEKSSPTKVLMPALDEPPGLSSDDDDLDGVLDEPPGYSSSSNDSDDGGLGSSFGTSSKITPTAPNEVLPVLPKPTSPKPVSPSTEFPPDARQETEAERKQRKLERKKKKKEKKEKKRMEKERKKKEKKEKKKEKKEKKKKKDSDSDSGKSDSESQKKDSELKVKISLKPPNPTPGSDGKKKRGRPPTKKSPKPKKPRGRPPKDPDRAAEKQRQLDIERGLITPNSKQKDESKKMSPQSLIEPPSSMTLSSSSDSSDDDLPIDRNPPKPPTVKIPTPIVPPVIKPDPPKPEKVEKEKPPKTKIISKHSTSALGDLFKPDHVPKPKPKEKPKPNPVRKRSRSRSPPIEKIEKSKKKDISKSEISPPDKMKKSQNPPKKQKLFKEEKPKKSSIPEIKPPVAKVLDQQRKQVKVKEPVKPIGPLVMICVDGNWNITTKMEPKPAKPIKKESSKKPIAQKEPSKLLKKEKPEATPTVQVAASTTLPPVESASKNTYLVVEGDTQKVIDYGDEVWICPMCKRQDDGSPMIGCDSCDDWYHNACLKILTVPTGEWYCPKCEKKRNDQKKKKKRK